MLHETLIRSLYSMRRLSDLQAGLWDKVAGGGNRIMTFHTQHGKMGGKLCLSCDRDYSFDHR